MPRTHSIRSRSINPARTVILAGAAAAALTVLASPVSAQFAIMPKIGTLGIGADVGVGLAPMVGLRGGFSFMPIEPEGSFSDGNWKVQLPNSFTAGIDVHPAGSGFRLSGGLLFQPDDVVVDAAFSGTIEVGGQTYSDDEIASLSGTVENGSTAPYITLGWGKSVPGVGFFLEAGVAFLGDPELTLTADGLLAGDPSFQADLERERQEVEDDLDSYARYYPILSLGLKIGLGG